MNTFIHSRIQYGGDNNTDLHDRQKH